MYAVNDGIITSLSDIKINDESIENFDNVSYEIRYDYEQINCLFKTLTTQRTIKKLAENHQLLTLKPLPMVMRSLLYRLPDVPKRSFFANDQGGISGYSVKGLGIL